MSRWLATLASLAVLAGCAIRPVSAPPVVRTPPPAASPAPPPRPPGPSPGTRVGTTASGGTITRNDSAATAPAVVDSTPSAEALEVLRSIPEPLAAGDAGRRGAVDTAAVPVPSPTRPLGDRPGSGTSPALPESLAAPITAPPAIPPPPVASASPDSCWRVQVVAPPERERADRLAEAARSQLLLAFEVEREGGLYKVRTRDCLSAGAADDVRRRAIASGFEGAFRLLRKRP